jgi:hypothetical protein
MLAMTRSGKVYHSVDGRRRNARTRCGLRVSYCYYAPRVVVKLYYRYGEIRARYRECERCKRS